MPIFMPLVIILGDRGRWVLMCFIGLHRLAFLALVFGPWVLLRCAEQDWSCVLIERQGIDLSVLGVTVYLLVNVFLCFE
jgi:hypothetical protein